MRLCSVVDIDDLKMWRNECIRDNRNVSRSTRFLGIPGQALPYRFEIPHEGKIS